MKRLFTIFRPIRNTAFQLKEQPLGIDYRILKLDCGHEVKIAGLHTTAKWIRLVSKDGKTARCQHCEHRASTQLQRDRRREKLEV